MVPQDPQFPGPLLPQGGQPPFAAGMLPGRLPPGMLPGAMPPGPRFHPGIPLPNGTLLANRYEVADMLLEGRCGFIYVTRDRAAQGAMRLIKTFDPRRGDRKDEDLFRREARLLQALEHPRIPKGYGIADHEGMLCGPQDYAQGEELASYMHTRGPLPEREVIPMLAQVLEILAYCHERTPSVLHRDLKPENLLRDQEGALYLVDFGSATDRPVIKEGVPLENLTAMQTLGYAAPEQVYGLEAYPASDLYAVGALAVHMLTAKHPIYLYDGMAGRLAFEASISEHLREWVEAMLAIPVATRIQSARAALTRLMGG